MKEVFPVRFNLITRMSAEGRRMWKAKQRGFLYPYVRGRGEGSKGCINRRIHYSRMDTERKFIMMVAEEVGEGRWQVMGYSKRWYPNLLPKLVQWAVVVVTDSAKGKGYVETYAVRSKKNPRRKVIRLPRYWFWKG